MHRNHFMRSRSSELSGITERHNAEERSRICLDVWMTGRRYSYFLRRNAIGGWSATFIYAPKRIFSISNNEQMSNRCFQLS